MADVFVYDAFACAHRSTPSGVGFTYLIPCVAGELMKNEMNQLDRALENPARPCIAVLGGIKVDDSILVADNMLRNNICDEFWPTGGVANLLLELSGVEIGATNHDFLVNELGKMWHQTVETAKSLLSDFGEKIRLPVDVAANIEDNRVDLQVAELPIDAPIFDLGIQSIRNLSAAIKSAGTVHLNGPAGVFELPDFAFGTVEMLNACAESTGYAVMGGGHTATLVAKRCLKNGPCFHRWRSMLGLHFRPQPTCCRQFRSECKSVLDGNSILDQHVVSGATGEIRTPDLLITNQVLYQLSHSGAILAPHRMDISETVESLHEG